MQLPLVSRRPLKASLLVTGFVPVTKFRVVSGTGTPLNLRRRHHKRTRQQYVVTVGWHAGANKDPSGGDLEFDWRHFGMLTRARGQRNRVEAISLSSGRN